MERHKSHVPNHQPAYYTMGLLDPVIIPSNGPTESSNKNTTAFRLFLRDRIALGHFGEARRSESRWLGVIDPFVSFCALHFDGLGVKQETSQFC